MFFYSIFSLILIFIQSFLILSAPVNFYPEILLFPYLVNKGLLPYRDFFDHHGFLLYYLFSFFSFEQNFNYFFYFVYWLIQSLSLIIFLVILKKSGSKSVFFIFGFIFVLLNYFFSDQTLWYENFIVFFYLLIYLIISDKNKKNYSIKLFLLGFFSFLSSLIKPTAAIILLPLVLFAKSWLIAITFTFFWLMIFLFFYLKGGFFQIINSLFLFNFYLGEKYPKEKIFDFNLIFLILLFLLFALFIIFKNKQIRRTTLLLSFFISALIFPFLKYARYHIVPIVPFFLLIMAKGYGIQKKNLVNFFRISILFFLVFLIIKIKNQYFLNQKRVVWQNSIDYKVVYQLKELKIENKKILIIGDHGEFYIYLNKIPPTYFPLIFNFVPQYFPFFYDDYLKALNRVDFLLVFINDKSAKEVLKNKKIKDFINKKFKKVIKEKNYLIYLKN